jgi:hypothetical protein
MLSEKSRNSSAKHQTSLSARRTMGKTWRVLIMLIIIIEASHYGLRNLWPSANSLFTEFPDNPGGQPLPDKQKADRVLTSKSMLTYMFTN